MAIKDKTIVITGGSSGIGYQMLRSLHSANRVLVIARPGPRLEALAQEFAGVELYPADLSQPQEYEAVVARISQQHQHIDVLINNAASQHTPTYRDDDFSYAAIAPEINLNLTAVCSLSYLLLPMLLRANEQAVIANVNSGLALAPKTWNSAVYCATKAAMDAFSRSLSYQLEGSNVMVMQAFLPLVDTPMTQGRGSGKISAAQAATEILRGIEQGDANQRYWQGEIAALVVGRCAIGLARRIMRGS